MHRAATTTEFSSAFEKVTNPNPTVQLKTDLGSLIDGERTRQIWSPNITPLSEVEMLEEQKIVLNQKAESLALAISRLREALQEDGEVLPGKLKDEKLGALHAHYTHLEGCIASIERRINQNGIAYFVNDEGYNPEMLNDFHELHRMLAVGCPTVEAGGDPINPNTAMGRILFEKSIIYGDACDNDPNGTDRKSESDQMNEIDVGLKKNGDMTMMRSAVISLGMESLHNHRNMAAQTGNIFQPVDGSAIGGNGKKWGIDFVRGGKLRQLEHLMDSADRIFTAARNIVLMRRQIEKVSVYSNQ